MPVSAGHLAAKTIPRTRAARQAWLVAELKEVEHAIINAADPTSLLKKLRDLRHAIEAVECDLRLDGIERTLDGTRDKTGTRP